MRLLILQFFSSLYCLAGICRLCTLSDDKLLEQNADKQPLFIALLLAFLFASLLEEDVWPLHIGSRVADFGKVTEPEEEERDLRCRATATKT